MSQVVELLETFQTKEVSHEEATLHTRASGITLYEAHSNSPHSPVKKRNPARSLSHREGGAQGSKPVNGRSKSEPPKE